ncbi:hypothetical protein N9S63_01870 [OM182 bacterium]|nr:hypothetical protein [OM182 bacterium]
MAPQSQIVRFQVSGLKGNFICSFRLLVLYLVSFHAVSYGQGSLLGELAQGGRIAGTESAECPSLLVYYQKSQDFIESETAVESWAVLADELMSLMPSCLRSSEYFAFLGAAQLNSGENLKAIESLERSLLLNPEELAARVDYAQALYSVGQLFPALEISEGLLGEDEFPPGVLLELENRTKLWRSETRQNSFFFDIGGGYDNNLNGAPNVNEIYLTLSGEEVSLSLDNAFESTNGGYSSLRLGNQMRVLAPDHQHGWSNEIRGRSSKDHRSDLLRLDSRYSFIKASRSRNWRVDGGLTHLLFGGDSLFSAAQLSGRYQFSSVGACNPAVEVAGQRQYFRQQSVLDGIEGKLAGRIQCDLNDGRGRYSSISVDVGALRNYSLRSARPGGNREGWQASIQWQAGRFLAQASQTHLDDRLGYSPILAGGAKRWINRSQVVLQYRQPLRMSGLAASWFVSVFHQDQESNINLFTARDTSLEVGLGFVF